MSKKEQCYIIIGIEENESDLQNILEIALQIGIWSPRQCSIEYLTKTYPNINFPKNLNYDTYLLFSSKSKDELERLKETIALNDLDVYFSNFF